MRGRRDEGQGPVPSPRAYRRSPGTRKPQGRSDSERIADVAAHADVPVEEVLRDVADFRLALETDMIIAAAAVDAESPELLSEVLDGERMELATFHDRLLERLADAAADDEITTRRARNAAAARTTRKATGRARASWLVAAAAAALAILGAGRAVVTGPADLRGTDSVAMKTADARFSDFSSAVSGDSTVAMQQAADSLHQTLKTLIAEHASDPAVAQRTAQMLQAEISLLRATDPAGASAVLAQARKLVTMLKKVAPPQVRASVKPVLDAADAPRTPPKPKASASPAPSAKPKPTASPSPSHSPSSSPRSSGSASPPGTNPLDTP